MASSPASDVMGDGLPFSWRIAGVATCLLGALLVVWAFWLPWYHYDPGDSPPFVPASTFLAPTFVLLGFCGPALLTVVFVVVQLVTRRPWLRVVLAILGGLASLQGFGTPALAFAGNTLGQTDIHLVYDAGFWLTILGYILTFIGSMLTALGRARPQQAVPLASPSRAW